MNHCKRPTVFLDEGTTHCVIVEHELPHFACIKCREEVTGTPYQFSGGLACEQCVRNYYQKAYSDLVGFSKLELEAGIVEELLGRAKQGLRIL